MYLFVDREIFKFNMQIISKITIRNYYIFTAFHKQ